MSILISIAIFAALALIAYAIVYIFINYDWPIFIVSCIVIALAAVFIFFEIYIVVVSYMATKG